MNNSLENAKKLYNEGNDINKIIYNAIKYGNDEILNWAIKIKNADYFSAAITAIKFNRANSFKILIDYINVTYETFYISAVNSGDTDIVKIIYKTIKAKYPNELKNILDEMSYEAGNWGRLILCEWLYKHNGNIESILEGAIESGNLTVIIWAVQTLINENKLDKHYKYLKTIYDNAKLRDYKQIVKYLENII